MRQLRFISFVTLSILSVGCYTLQPAVGVSPEIGAQVAFDVNDAGRFALGGSMGLEIAQIEGRLVETSSEDYLVAVSALRLLRGGVQVWRGERVRIGTAHVGTPYIRKFSKGRSIALGAVVVGGFAAFMLSRGLLGGGTTGDPIPPDPGGGDAIVIRP